MHSIVKAFDHLHTKDRLVHGGKYITPTCENLPTQLYLTLNHIMPCFENLSVLQRYTKSNEEKPSGYSNFNVRPNHKKWHRFETTDALISDVKLTDIGFTIEVKGIYKEEILADVYMAPEVMLRGQWSYPADIWEP
jgi:hypothetical protein